MRDLIAFLTTPRPDSDRHGSGTMTTATATTERKRATPESEPVNPPARELPRLATEVAFPNLRFERPVAMAYPDDGSNTLNLLH